MKWVIRVLIDFEMASMRPKGKACLTRRRCDESFQTVVRRFVGSSCGFIL
jgi:hypothetical protein